MTAATPGNIMIQNLMKSFNPEPPGFATPTFLTHRNCEIINVACFKLLNSLKCSNGKRIHSELKFFPVGVRGAKTRSLCRIGVAMAMKAMTKDRGYLEICNLRSYFQGQII